MKTLPPAFLIAAAINCHFAAAEKPNVLFIIADDLGIGDLACYGNELIDTSVLDQLAGDGVRFTNHYSPSPLCAPARAGLLTGRYNHRTGAIDVSSNRGIDRIALSEQTFGDYFKNAGYTTALIGKWHNGLYCADYLPHKRGFDLFYGFANGQQDYWKWNLQRNDIIEKHDGRYMTDVFNQEACAFIRQCAEKNELFALVLTHHPPHPPYQAPQDLIEKYKPRIAGKYDETVAIIYAMIERMDSGLAHVFQTLETCGIRENTIIVFTSDNGAQLSGKQMRPHAGLRGNKGNVLEQGIRVPAIVSWSGTLPQGVVNDTPIHGCDWLPTLFSLTGSTPPAGAKPLDGKNLMPLLRSGVGSAVRALCFQKNRYTPVAHSDGAIRRGKWKLYWPGEKTTMTKDIGRDNPSFERGSVELPWEMPIDPGLPDYSNVQTAAPQLFDLEADPGETTDLSAARPELVQELAKAYDSWFADVSRDWKISMEEIIEHDDRYWKDRVVPDPGTLFADFWQWKRSPGTSPETDDPLDVFTGYWNGKQKRGDKSPNDE